MEWEVAMVVVMGRVWRGYGREVGRVGRKVKAGRSRQEEAEATINTIITTTTTINATSSR
jgi:hypothetical protein